jgi:hypothetical protein
LKPVVFPYRLLRHLIQFGFMRCLRPLFVLGIAHFPAGTNAEGGTGFDRNPRAFPGAGLIGTTPLP